MQPVMNPKYPGLSVRVADEGFAPYIWGSDFSFEVAAYGAAVIGQPVEQWRVTPIVPYRKCYGIDPEEFSAFHNAPDSAIFMAYLDDEPVGHLVISTNWNGFARAGASAWCGQGAARCRAVLEPQEKAAGDHARNPEQQPRSLSVV
jgi:hypothetical protein